MDVIGAKALLDQSEIFIRHLACASVTQIVDPVPVVVEVREQVFEASFYMLLEPVASSINLFV